MTPMEFRGLVRGALLLAALAVGRAVWEGREPAGDPLGQAPDLGGELLERSRQARAISADRRRPLAPGDRLDPNRADEAALERLPGVGPAVARAIVEHRQARGGYARPEDLLGVRGIGPATLERIRPFLDFGAGVPPELRRPAGPPAGGGGSSFRFGTSPRPPGAGPGAEGAPGDGSVAEGRGPAGFRSPAPLDVNRATEEELRALPGIGPALAARIVESRTRQGPFRTPEDLLRVKGIGPATLERIRPWIVVR